MAFRFRKSINLGGFRINLSKSGIGYSFGVKGLRFTHKAGGGSRTTIGIPNTGISYVKDYSTHKKASTIKAEKKEVPISVGEEIEDELIESSPHEMIDRLNRADKLYNIFSSCRIALPVIGFLFFAVFFAIVYNGMKIPLDSGEILDGTIVAVICGVLSALFFIAGIVFLLQKVKIDISYDFSKDERFEGEFSDLMKGFAAFQTAEKIWEVRDDVPREKARTSFAPLAPYINTDLDIKAMKLLRKEFLFLPDIIAVKQQNGWAGISYAEVDIAVHDEQMEETTVLSDTTVLSERWLHAKKDGGRNMQFQNNNYLIYNCLYGKLTFLSNKGLNASLLCSSNEKAKNFCAALEKYRAFMKA